MIRSAAGRMLGMARSLAIYHGQVWKRRRMEAFYGQFIGPGDLCFDIGAHAGNRVRAFTRLGARVVAVEPQPAFFKLLERLYGRRDDVILLSCGIADRPGELELLVSSRTPTVSTFSKEWIDDVVADPRFARVDWDERVTVPVDTLDGLIAQYGEPAFCKIDVEGFEEQVLAGLSRPLRALSFEYVAIAVPRAIACIDRVMELGDYRFRWSTVENMRWNDERWLEADEMRDVLSRLPTTARSGDVYAMRADAIAH
jgi:FkbM family methyltransferase